MSPINPEPVDDCDLCPPGGEEAQKIQSSIRATHRTIYEDRDVPVAVWGGEYAFEEYCSGTTAATTLAVKYVKICNHIMYCRPAIVVFELDIKTGEIRCFVFFVYHPLAHFGGMAL